MALVACRSLGIVCLVLFGVRRVSFMIARRASFVVYCLIFGVCCS